MIDSILAHIGDPNIGWTWTDIAFVSVFGSFIALGLVNFGLRAWLIWRMPRDR